MSAGFCLIAERRAGALESAFDDITVEDYEVLMLLWEWLRVYAACATHDSELRRTGCLDSGLL